MTVRKGFILLVCIVIVVGAIVAFFPGVSSYIPGFKSVSKETVPTDSNETKVVAADTQVFNIFEADTSLANQQAYIQGADAELANLNLSTSVKNLILLRKVSAIADVRRQFGSTDSADIVAANKTLEDFINVSNATGTALRFKDAAIASLGLSEVQCCTLATDPMGTPPFTSYTTYKAMGYSDALAKLLAVDDLTQQVSAVGQGNIINRANAVDAELKILNGYSNQLKPDVLERIKTELGQHIAYYANLSPAEIAALPPTGFFSIRRFVTGYDVYTSLNVQKLTPAINADIDSRYESYNNDLLVLIANNKSVTAAREHLFYNQIRYLESLERRYGKHVDQKKINQIATSLITNVQSSKEVGNIAAWYLNQIWTLKKTNPDFARMYGSELNFYTLAKTNTQVGSYLASIGITQ